MKLTQRLLDLLNRVFDKDPKAFVALNVEGDQNWTWSVSDRVLTVTVAGAPAATFALGEVTIGALALALSDLPGLTASVADEDRGGLMASVILDGSADVLAGTVGQIKGYTSLLWALLEGWAVELTAFREQVAAAPDQLSLTTGTGVWLDEIGGYYGVTRSLNEPDRVYGPRVIAEALRPRSNNVALAAAIKVYTGQDAEVIDVVEYGDVFPLHDGTIQYDGVNNHDAGAINLYGLFDVVYGFDLESGTDITVFQGELRKLINRLRAAGTHLRALALQSSALADRTSRGTDAVTLQAAYDEGDAAALPDDAMTLNSALSTMVDTAPSQIESSTLQIPLRTIRNGVARRNGFRIHSERAVLTQNIEGTVSTIVPE